MIHRDLVPESLVPTRVREKRPAGAACQRLRRAHELTTPHLDAAKVLFEQRPELVRNFVPIETPEAGVALAAEITEVKLVKRHRVHRALLLALQRAQSVRRRARLQRGELAARGVQRPHGAAVVVLIVAHDHSLRDAVERPRPYRNRTDLFAAWSMSFLRLDVLRMSGSCRGLVLAPGTSLWTS